MYIFQTGYPNFGADVEGCKEEQKNLSVGGTLQSYTKVKRY